MNVTIVPIGSGRIVEVGRLPGQTLVRHIDRALRGTASLTETNIAGDIGVPAFISRLQSGDDFGDSLAWLIDQNS